MSTPLVTVANSIIEFILSLLRDPAAQADLKEDPEGTLARHKMSGVCADDVRAVAPVIYDRPDVVPKAHHTPPPPSDNDVVNEITRITSNWTWIDNRATIVDQSVNQNIWTEGGDVTQEFDQSAGVASGDDSIASGDDTTIGGAPDPDETPDETSADGMPAMPEAPGDVTDEGAAVDVLSPEETDVPGDDATGPAGLDEALPVPQDDAPAVEAIENAADPLPAAEPAAPSFEEPAADVDDSVWSEPSESVVVEEPVYAEDLGEEQ